MIRRLLTRLLTCVWVLACASPTLGQTRSSAWLEAAPTLDGALDREWRARSTRSSILESPHASAFFANDATALYVFVDVLGDNVDDPRDLLSVVVDVNRDLVLNRRDVSFQFGAQPERSGITIFNGDGWSPGGALQDIRYFTAFGGARVQFRHWEAAIPLARLRARPGDAVNLALRMTTGQPQLESWLPQNQQGGVTSFLKLQLAVPAGQVTPTGPRGTPGVDEPPVRMTPQGLKRTNPDGSYDILLPEGNRRFDANGQLRGTTRAYTVDVIPPDAPSAKQDEWLQTRAAALLGVIRKLVDGDEASVNAYLTVYEPGSPSTYLKVHMRIWIIQQLVGSSG
jgi:hypothetical protein